MRDLALKAGVGLKCDAKLGGASHCGCAIRLAPANRASSHVSRFRQALINHSGQCAVNHVRESFEKTGF
jgi:hypothetical protein